MWLCLLRNNCIYSWKETIGRYFQAAKTIRSKFRKNQRKPDSQNVQKTFHIMIPTALIIITFFVLQSYAISYCIMMESTRQQWRVYAIATIALIVIILLSTQVSLRFQVHNTRASTYFINCPIQSTYKHAIIIIPNLTFFLSGEIPILRHLSSKYLLQSKRIQQRVTRYD